MTTLRFIVIHEYDHKSLVRRPQCLCTKHTATVVTHFPFPTYMEFLTSFFRRTPKTNPDGGGETPTPVELETVAGIADGSLTDGGETRSALFETPPTDDVCPICFGSFDIPCRAPCGHWFCGGCILQYWNFSAAMQPCRCPMCSQNITKLTPEASLYSRSEVEICKVLKNVSDYNRLFVGGISGLVLKLLAIPLYLKRMSRDMLNPDRPGLYLHELRLIAAVPRNYVFIQPL